MIHGAKGAIPGTGVTHDQERGGLMGPAGGEVRAFGAGADRMEMLSPQELGYGKKVRMLWEIYFKPERFSGRVHSDFRAHHFP